MTDIQKSNAQNVFELLETSELPVHDLSHRDVGLATRWPVAELEKEGALDTLPKVEEGTPPQEFSLQIRSPGLGLIACEFVKKWQRWCVFTPEASEKLRMSMDLDQFIETIDPWSDVTSSHKTKEAAMAAMRRLPMAQKTIGQHLDEIGRLEIALGLRHVQYGRSLLAYTTRRLGEWDDLYPDDVA